MRKTLLIAISLVISCSAFSQTDDEPWLRPKAADYPVIIEMAASCEGFAPSSFKLMEKSEGDLNGDGKPDCVAVFIGTDKRFQNKNEGLGEEVFDTNPRILTVGFGAVGGGFKLHTQNNNFIVSAETPTQTEPFQGITIEKGVLKFVFEEFYSAGSWTSGSRRYTFRYQNGEITLIGVEKTAVHRASGDIETRSYNFMTGKMSIDKGHISDDGTGKVRWRKFTLKPLPTLRNVKPMFNWEIEKDVFI